MVDAISPGTPHNRRTTGQGSQTNGHRAPIQMRARHSRRDTSHQTQHMGHAVITRIAEQAGATPVATNHLFGEIRQISFAADTEYEAIAAAAAAVDAETSNDIRVWGCGVSIDGCPRVAIQRFESTDPSDADGYDHDREYSILRSRGTAARGSVTARPSQSSDTATK